MTSGAGIWYLRVWEEWIEIIDFLQNLIYNRSLPVWEEWIEMAATHTAVEARAVSSRMGRVD